MVLISTMTVDYELKFRTIITIIPLTARTMKQRMVFFLQCRQLLSANHITLILWMFPASLSTLLSSGLIFNVCLIRMMGSLRLSLKTPSLSAD